MKYNSHGLGEALDTDLVTRYELMAAGALYESERMYISNYTIEMLVMAMVTGEWQAFPEPCDDC